MRRMTLIGLGIGFVALVVTLLLSGTDLDPGQRALDEWEAEQPLPTATPILPLPEGYVCQESEDLERFPPGSQILATREIWLVEDPSQDHPVVTGIVHSGDLLIVKENAMGISCATTRGTIFYYVHQINNGDQPGTAKGFANSVALEGG